MIAQAQPTNNVQMETLDSEGVLSNNNMEKIMRLEADRKAKEVRNLINKAYEEVLNDNALKENTINWREH